MAGFCHAVGVEMERVDVAPLFAPLHRELIQLLRSLSDDAWNRPTVAGKWRVRDVAAHLLDGMLRKLAAHRDGHLLRAGHSPPRTYDDVVTLINSLNATGVTYGERLSTRLLVDLLEVTGAWLSDFMATLDPTARALFPVSWAGETESQNWMDTGREYTEHWHHQMQIREAAGAPLLLDDVWYEPLMSLSVRALPRTYAEVPAAVGTSINLRVDDRAWAWCLVREGDAWHLYSGAAAKPAASIQIRRTDAWRLFYNALDAPEAESILRIEGDRSLGIRLIAARSVMV
jgi:hypothetical protein